MKEAPLSIFWFRRDLRIEDNAALYHALRSGKKVLPIFIFDRNILDRLDNRSDRRVQFIHSEVNRLHQQLAELGSGLLVCYGKAEEVWRQLLQTYEVAEAFANHDYEPYARTRDEEVGKMIAAAGGRLHTYKDTVIFEKDEVLKDDGTPYTVFTPYSRKWKARLNSFYCKDYPVHKYSSELYRFQAAAVPALEEMGFRSVAAEFPERKVKGEVIAHYHQTRDLPAVNGTSQLGLHLRFGTLSIRQLLSFALTKNEAFVNELIWRDFYQMILWHFPRTVDQSFRKEYDRIEWRNNEQDFENWCMGRTGYPLVDAGMRQLNATGWMHNRVRMVVASFLTKHLLIDWRWGERYFAEKLTDFDLAANVGGWQWAAGCGTDAAPYFRVFNPQSQQERFDPHFVYIKQWVPELGTAEYPAPIVEHHFARNRALAHYQRFLKGVA